jgi:hypothetical protein
MDERMALACLALLARGRWSLRAERGRWAPGASDYDLAITGILAPRGARFLCWRTMLVRLVGRRLVAGLG